MVYDADGAFGGFVLGVEDCGVGVWGVDCSLSVRAGCVLVVFPLGDGLLGEGFEPFGGFVFPGCLDVGVVDGFGHWVACLVIWGWVGCPSAIAVRSLRSFVK